jgi:hypothetical protein
MEIFIILLGILILIPGIILLFKKPEYQLEKTTSGKMIRFLDYNESKKIKRIKLYGIILLTFGAIAIGAGTYIYFLHK